MAVLGFLALTLVAVSLLVGRPIGTLAALVVMCVGGALIFGKPLLAF